MKIQLIPNLVKIYIGLQNKGASADNNCSSFKPQLWLTIAEPY